MCFNFKNETQIKVAAILSTIFAYLMIAIIIGAMARMLNSPIVSPSSLILLVLGFVFFLAGCMHPKEFKCLFPSVLYFLSLPSAFVLLNIYSFINLNNISWGTREIKPNTENKSKEKDMEEKSNKCWIDHECLIKSDIEILPDKETKFFDHLIKKHLRPYFREEEDANKKRLGEDLKELRNYCCFYFLFLNSIWILLLFMLQVLKNKLIDKIYIDITIFGSSIKYEPVYFVYVMLFVVILMLQFLAMIWHRTITFIQVIRKTNLRSNERVFIKKSLVGDLNTVNSRGSGFMNNGDNCNSKSSSVATSIKTNQSTDTILTL